jgi:hypothetical protein
VYFWEPNGFLYSEWNNLLDQALIRPEASGRTLIRAKALNAVGLMLWSATASTVNRAALDEALSI